MAYRRLAERRAERERAELERAWMTMPEAIKDVEVADSSPTKPPQRSAIDQICDAIEDGELGSRWRDQSPPVFIGALMPVNDHPIFSVPRWRERIGADGKITWGRNGTRELLLNRADMARLFRSSGPTRDKKRGPKPGVNTYRAADERLFGQIKKLIDSGDARSPNSAVQLIPEDRFKGSGSIESKRRRVAQRYRAQNG